MNENILIKNEDKFEYLIPQEATIKVNHKLPKASATMEGKSVYLLKTLFGADAYKDWTEDNPYPSHTYYKCVKHPGYYEWEIVGGEPIFWTGVAGTSTGSFDLYTMNCIVDLLEKGIDFKICRDDIMFTPTNFETLFILFATSGESNSDTRHFQLGMDTWEMDKVVRSSDYTKSYAYSTTPAFTSGHTLTSGNMSFYTVGNVTYIYAYAICASHSGVIAN